MSAGELDAAAVLAELDQVRAAAVSAGLHIVAVSELLESAVGGSEHPLIVRAFADLGDATVAVEAATRALDEARAALSAGDDVMTRPECPGCVGRGTGTVCVACGGEIPELWRRSDESPSEYREDCRRCVAGSRHSHGDGVERIERGENEG